MSTEPATGEVTISIEQLLAGSDYQVVSRLGAGGMGEVYAVRAQFGRMFALKTLHPFFSASAEFVSRMKLEARAMGQLQHPHIVDVFNFWVTHQRPCILMQLLKGRNVAQELRARRRLPPAEAADLVCQALDGLSAAHRVGIVHRDLKPENLFLHELPPGFGRILKVLDFGVVRLLEGSSTLAPPTLRTQTGTVVGSPRWASPEQRRAEPVDHRTDLYSLGMVLYAMLAGRGPYDMGEQQASPPSCFAPELPPALDAVVMRAIEPSRDERYQSADELLRDLRAQYPASEELTR